MIKNLLLLLDVYYLNHFIAFFSKDSIAIGLLSSSAGADVTAPRLLIQVSTL